MLKKKYIYNNNDNHKNNNDNNNDKNNNDNDKNYIVNDSDKNDNFLSIIFIREGWSPSRNRWFHPPLSRQTN